MIFIKAWEDFRKATRYDSAPLELVIIGIINTPRPNGAKKRAEMGMARMTEGPACAKGLRWEQKNTFK